MKWFKHDSNASLDAKLLRLRLKYGMEGYGVYWFLLESIARNVEKHNLTFELEEDAELVAAQTNIHYERVQEMMVYMCNLGLFENADGRITCLKMATRTDEYTQQVIRKSPDTLQTLSRYSQDKVRGIRIEENRIDKNRIEKDKGQNRTRFVPPTAEQVADYVSTREKTIDPERFVDFYASKNWMIGKNKMKDWQAAVRNWEKREDGQVGQANRKNTRGPEVVTAADLLNEGYVLNG